LILHKALHHEKYGYYQQKKEKIGTGGDFITSPEITQLFGEMVGIWCVSTWQNMGCPTAINLVELGPGNGTLMKDVLNIVRKFPVFEASLKVSMVEISPAMRELQRDALECTGVTTTSSDSDNDRDASDHKHSEEQQHNDWAEQTEAECMKGITKGGIPIAWYNYLKHVPAGPALYVGHEILDAFPVHQFSKTAEQGRWRETMVDVDFDEGSPYHFRFVKTPTITPALRIFFNKTFTGIADRPLSSSVGDVEGEGREGGEDAKTDKDKLDTSGAAVSGKCSAVSALSTSGLEGLELSPLAFSTVEEIAQNVVKHQGAALLIDYGEQFPQV
jgi:NADH dehydrogenase [ubiquinone] 1 alpha subcomplex assembly factor 7